MNSTLSKQELKRSRGSSKRSANEDYSQLPRKKPALMYDAAGLRLGKWEPDEERYANVLIELFEKGLAIDCNNGDTLRAYLSKKLQSNPMRISKKFAGKCIGSLCFTRMGSPCGSDDVLENLEMRFWQSVYGSPDVTDRSLSDDSSLPYIGQAGSILADVEDDTSFERDILLYPSNNVSSEIVFDSDFEFTASLTENDFLAAFGILPNDADDTSTSKNEEDTQYDIEAIYA